MSDERDTQADPPGATTGKKPLNVLQFVSMEGEQFLVSLANNNHDKAIARQIQGLYEAALSDVVTHEDNLVLFQLLTFTHYHFLFSTACFMRCHLSEAFASARVAIDAALIAAQIIHDRASQVAYARREKPFDKLNRHFKNLVRDKKSLPHPLIPHLLNYHDKMSQFASHADVNVFIHRINLDRDGGRLQSASMEYFQFARNEPERQIHALDLFHSFVMVLDVFADFLTLELKKVPEQWTAALHELGATMERHARELRTTIRGAAGSSADPATPP